MKDDNKKHKKYDKQNKSKIEKNIDDKNKKLLNKKVTKKNIEKEKINNDKIKDIKNNTYPNNFKYLEDLVTDDFDNKCEFIIFKSINDILFLAYIKDNNSIILYDIIDKKKINEIKNIHNGKIQCFNYSFDSQNKRDLILSSSLNDIKIWDINNLECLLNLKDFLDIDEDDEYYEEFKCDIFFINYNNKIYFLIYYYFYYNNLIVYDLKGKKIKNININNLKFRIDYIETYYDNKKNKFYLIVSSYPYIKSYDCNDNKEYHKYYEGDNFYKLIINKEDKEIIKLIGIKCRNNGDIIIWNFNSGEKLNIINIRERISLNCLWNNRYLLVGCEPNDNWETCDNKICVIDLKDGKIIKDLITYKKFYINYIIKLIHPKYGECLLSRGYDNIIKLWIIEN